MIFQSETIAYSAEEHWDELVSITFVCGNDYLSFSALAYEDEVAVEFNDQVNVITVLKSDFKCDLLNECLYVTLKNPITRNNFPDLSITVHVKNPENEKLARGIKALTADSTLA